MLVPWSVGHTEVPTVTEIVGIRMAAVLNGMLLSHFAAMLLPASCHTAILWYNSLTKLFPHSCL